MNMFCSRRIADTKVFLAVKIEQVIGCSIATIFTVDSDIGVLCLLLFKPLVDKNGYADRLWRA